MNNPNQSPDNIFDENAEVSSDADSAIISQPGGQRLIRIIESGKRVVVAFEIDLLEVDNAVSVYREELIALIHKHDCKEFVFDLTGINFVPSGVVGLIASLHSARTELQVIVRNPSTPLREVFAVTRLDQFIKFEQE
jgi:anti-sigma B factor antagonist